MVLLVWSLGSPAVAQTEREVEDAEQARAEASERVDELTAELETAIRHYQNTTCQLAELEGRLHRLQSRLDDGRSTAALLQHELTQLAREAYMGGSGDLLTVALDSGSLQDLLTTEELVARASLVQESDVDRLEVANREVERLAAGLEVERERLAGLLRAAGEAEVRIDELFHLAQAEYEESAHAAEDATAAFAAEQRRLAEADGEGGDGRSGGGAAGAPGLVCPSGTPLSFINDWGFPRSGGRTHQGTDVFAPRGTPVYAVTDGVVRTHQGGIGGVTVWLNGDDGNGYYYAHLEGWAPGLATGTRVDAGQVIGFVGSSGNAMGTSPHTHFQIHPDGGSPVNPYKTLAGLCQR